MRAPALCGVVTVLFSCGNSDSRDPGKVTLHRLNNAEYNNTVRDCSGTTLRPADDFPADDRAYGFDNVSGRAAGQPLSIELYERAAETLIEDALATTRPAGSPAVRAHRSTARRHRAGGWLFFSNGSATISSTAPGRGQVSVRRSRAYRASRRPRRRELSIEVAGQPQSLVVVTALQATPAVYRVEVMLPAGAPGHRRVRQRLLRRQGRWRDRNLWVDYVEVEGPFDGPTVDEGRARAARVRRARRRERASATSCRRS